MSLETGRRLITRHAGIFLFLPFLAQLRFDRLVTKADYPGSQMVPAVNALMSLLTLKLLDKERLSHVDDFNCDEALGLFAGLNILPKKSFATNYSYRTTRTHQQELLKGWVKKLSPLLFPEADSFSLDFHAIGHRGEETDLENHYQPMRGKAGPSVLTFFAMEQKSRVFCYANANLTRSQQSGEILRFIDFWRKLMGNNPQWLYFDSKLTTYAELSQITKKKKNISFVTIRRRGSSILRRLADQLKHLNGIVRGSQTRVRNARRSPPPRAVDLCVADFPQFFPCTLRCERFSGVSILNVPRELSARDSGGVDQSFSSCLPA